MSLSLLHVDDAVVAVNKPEGVVIHHGLPQEEVTLLDLLRAQVSGPLYPTHRLDRATSGAIVFARSREAAAAINGAFAARDVDKLYLALVTSAIEAWGEIEQPLTRRARQHGKGKQPLLPARTTYQCIARTADAALIELTPHTGRQHQLRRHLRAIGAPIWGDKRYGHKRHNRHLRIDVSLHRMALHAYQLTLPHPTTGDPLALVAPLPATLTGPLERLGFSMDALGLEMVTRGHKEGDAEA